jgi:hypothetical protein
MSLWKRIAVTFTGITLILGLLLIAVVFEFTGRALRAELHQRAWAVATNLSDAAAGFVMGRNFLELNALITKYARLDGIETLVLLPPETPTEPSVVRNFCMIACCISSSMSAAEAEAARPKTKRHIDACRRQFIGHLPPCWCVV